MGVARHRHSTVMLALLLACAFTLQLADAAMFGPQSVLQYHKNPNKDGFYVDPDLTGRPASRTEQLTAINTKLQGQSYGQLLYVDRGGDITNDLLISATEENVVTAIHPINGTVLWTKQVAKPVPSSSLPCGNIGPSVGITSTPVVDPATDSVIVSAKTTSDSGKTSQYQFFALRLGNGTSLPGFPVDVAKALAKQGIEFNTPAQLQRGGLLMLEGVAYAGYGGNSGDCQEYRGRVVGVNVSHATTVYSFNTTGNKGAIWAPGGPATDGKTVFVGTGNTAGATTFSQGNAVLGLPPNLTYNNSPQEFFAPQDWKHLDETDLDLGTAGPVPFDLPGATPQQLVFIGGKDGNVYLLDRNNLGGFDGEVVKATISSSVIITAPIIYRAGGATYAVIRGTGTNCPDNLAGDLIALKIVPGSPPSISTAWCANAVAKGNPPIATTDSATGNVTVWIIGANPGGTSNTLNAYDGVTGQLLYQSAEVGAASRYHTPIAAKSRIYLATTPQLVVFRVGTSKTPYQAPANAATAPGTATGVASDSADTQAASASGAAPAPQAASPTVSRGFMAVLTSSLIAAICAAAAQL